MSVAPSSPEHRERIKRERALFARLSQEGSALSWAERSPVAVRRREFRAARIAEAALPGPGDGEGSRVLDVGCGTALYTAPLAAQSRAEVVAVDVTPETLHRARAAVPPNVTLVGSDAVRVPFADDSFDAVVGNAILHHLPLDRAIPELLRVLRPGGRFCFAEPNLLNPHIFLMLKVPWIRRRFDTTPDEIAFVRWPLRRTLASFGLAEITIKPFDFLYPLIPESWIGVAEKFGRLAEATPGLREIAGSLLIAGRKPGA